MTVLRQGMNSSELYLGELTTSGGVVFEVVTDKENGIHLGVIRTKPFPDGFKFWRRVSVLFPFSKNSEPVTDEFGVPIQIAYSVYCVNGEKAEDLCRALKEQGFVVTLSGLTLEECGAYALSGNVPEVTLLNRGLPY